MSAITKLLGGMMKGSADGVLLLRIYLPGNVKPRERRNGETHGPWKLKPPFSQFLCRKSAVSQLKTGQDCEENLQKPSHVRHL